MPAVLKLREKTTDALYFGGKLIELDAEIALHFGGEPHTISWFCNWMNTIGFLLACGRSFDELREIFKEQEGLTLDIIDYLDDRFESRCYYEHSFGEV